MNTKTYFKSAKITELVDRMDSKGYFSNNVFRACVFASSYEDAVPVAGKFLYTVYHDAGEICLVFVDTEPLAIHRMYLEVKTDDQLWGCTLGTGAVRDRISIRLDDERELLVNISAEKLEQYERAWQGALDWQIADEERRWSELN